MQGQVQIFDQVWLLSWCFSEEVSSESSCFFFFFFLQASVGLGFECLFLWIVSR